VKREVSYQWRLREVMAAHGMFTVTELVPLLHERGIGLSASQVHRLASGMPERLSLAVLAALCDIFACTPAELIATRGQDAPVRKAATGDAVVNLNARRPKRAVSPSWLKLVHTSAAAGVRRVRRRSSAVMICCLASVHLLAASTTNTIVTAPEAPGPVRRAWRHCQVRAELANVSGSSCRGTTQSRWPPGARNTKASSQRDTGSAPSAVRRATSAARSSVSMSRW